MPEDTRKLKKANLLKDLAALKAQRAEDDERLAYERDTENDLKKYPFYKIMANSYEKLAPNAGPPSAGLRYLLLGTRELTDPAVHLMKQVDGGMFEDFHKDYDRRSKAADKVFSPTTLEMAAREDPNLAIDVNALKTLGRLPPRVLLGGVMPSVYPGFAPLKLFPGDAMPKQQRENNLEKILGDMVSGYGNLMQQSGNIMSPAKK